MLYILLMAILTPHTSHLSAVPLPLMESGKLLRCTQQLPIELFYCYCTIALAIAILLLWSSLLRTHWLEMLRKIYIYICTFSMRSLHGINAYFHSYIIQQLYYDNIQLRMQWTTCNKMEYISSAGIQHLDLVMDCLCSNSVNVVIFEVMKKISTE